METNDIIKEVDGYYINLSKRLGKGAFSEVYIATHPKTQQKFAAKIIPMALIQEDQTLLELINREITIQRKVTNEHVVHLLHVSKTANNLYLFTDLCEDGDLEHKINKKYPFTEQEACLIIWQIAAAFTAMGNVMHRDIKPANILLCNGKAKVADFGFAKEISEAEKTLKKQHTLLGTPLYMSPQILREETYTAKCDVWSTGCLFYELLFGRVPWNGTSIQNLALNKRTQPLKFPKYVNENTKDLLTKMLKYDEGKRIGWKEVLEHPALRPQELKEKKDFLNQIQIKPKGIVKL